MRLKHRSISSNSSKVKILLSPVTPTLCLSDDLVCFLDRLLEWSGERFRCRPHFGVEDTHLLGITDAFGPPVDFPACFREVCGMDVRLEGDSDYELHLSSARSVSTLRPSVLMSS